jgi:2-oxoacid:acceptor oxidoreductase delta subunit (pyruvate/2-ketoisovalerate family)
MRYINHAKKIIRKGINRGRGLDREEVLRDLKNRTSSLRSRIQILDRRLRKMEQGVLPYPLIPVVDPERCVGCGLCERVCPAHAISVEESARVDLDRCMGCGICVDQCPKSALSLRPLGRYSGIVKMPSRKESLG